MLQLKKLVSKLSMGQTPSDRSSTGSRISGSIVTVSSAPEEQKRLEQSKRLRALSELPIFLPLYSSNAQYEFCVERAENLNPRILLSACSNLNQFLQYSAAPVVDKENVLCQDIKQLEQKAVVVYHRCNSRYNLLTKIGPHLKRLQEVNTELRLMGEQLCPYAPQRMPVEYATGATPQDVPVFEHTQSPTSISGDQKLKCIGRYILTGNTLGKGNFARVEEASHCLTETKVAIKIIDIDRIQEDYVRKNLLREAKLMRGLKHPNIIRLYETMKTSHLYCMVTELADGGELLSHVRHDYKERRLPEAAARPFVRQLVSALQHLHSQGIVHRDLKMENILLDRKKRYTKIVDFGLSNAAQPGSLLATHCGSPEYAAPELFIPGRQYGPEVDIWSLGVNMFAMMVGKLPFRSPKQGARKRQRLLEMISNGLSEAHEKEMQHLTPACIDMIKMLLEPDISNRANLDDIMVHPWITKNGHYPLLPFKPLPPDPSVKQSALDLVCKSGNVTVEEVHDSVEKDKCNWMSALYHILLDSSEARKTVQRKLKTETKKGGSKQSSKESSKQSLLEYSFSLGERGSSDFVAYEYETPHATVERGDNDPTPTVEESYLDIMDIKAGQNTLRLHRNPIGTWERRRSASHPLDPDQLKDDILNRQDSSGGINYPEAPSARPRIPRTMTHHYRDGEPVVPIAATSRKSSAGNPPAYTLVHYESDKTTGDAPMQRSTSLEMRSGYNPTHTWDRLRNKSTQPQISYITQTATNQPYHTTPRPSTNTDSYSRRPYEYMDEGTPQHSQYRTSNHGHNLNTPMALSVDWAQYHQSQGNNNSGSIRKGKRNTPTSFLEHLNDYSTPTAQQTMPHRKSKDRVFVMPALNPDNTSTMPGYKVSLTDAPVETRQTSNTLPNRTKKPSKMPGTRGYNRSKDPNGPTRMLSNPDPAVSPFSANRGNNVYDFSFTGTGGYQWISDQQLAKSGDILDKSEKRKTFWKFRSKNKSKENLATSNMNTNKPVVVYETDTGVYATLSKKNIFTSSIHNLHNPADITSLLQDSGNGNTAQKMETDLVSKPLPNYPPMEESTPTTRIKANSKKSTLQQTVVTQVKPAPFGAGAGASASASAPSPPLSKDITNTTQIKVQLQQAIDGMNQEYQKQEIHEGGNMSDSGLATPGSSARDVDRPTSSKRLRSLLVRPFKSGKKKT